MFVFYKQQIKWIAMFSLNEHVLELSGPNLLPDVGPVKQAQNRAS